MSKETDTNNLTLQIANILKNGLQTQTQTPKQNLPDSLKISLNPSDIRPHQGMATTLAVTGPNVTDGMGLISKSHHRSAKGYPVSSSQIDKLKLKCTHCGMSRHTKEQCFRIVGYPDWWSDGHKRSGKEVAKAPSTVGASEAFSSGAGHQKEAYGGLAAAWGKQDEVEDTGHKDGNDHWAWH